MRSPSVIGVAEQYGLSPCVGSVPLNSTSFFHNSVPSLRLNAIVAREWNIGTDWYRWQVML